MILQALVRFYDRRAAYGDVPPYGFSDEGISFAILLDQEGRAVGTQSLQDTSGKRPRPSRRLVPRPVKRSVNVEPNFLWDNTAYVLGVKRDQSGSMVPVRRGEHRAFKQLHADLLAGQDDDGLRAVRRFLERWRPEDYEHLTSSDEMLGANVTFMLDGAEGLVADREDARLAWERHLSDNQAEPGPCLITGSRDAPIARLHPSIGGGAGAPSTGASLVSFNEPAFESYGRAQGSNAPVSELAAFKYGTALNALLARGSRQRILIGNTTVVFWAEAASRQEAEAAEDVCYLLAEPPATDEDEQKQVRLVLEKVKRGRPLREAMPECEDDTRFYVLGLEPNRARLVVRFWCETTIGDLARRLGEHWRDMRLEPEPWLTPPAAWRLLLETAVQRKRENIQPSLVAPLTRAIFTGAAYPQSLLLTLTARLRADGNLSGVRAAMLKACIRRPERLSQPEKEDDLVSLDTTSDNVPYLLGRLFAIFVYAEKAVAKRSATISDKWFGSASSSPSRAFPSLMRGFRHNISKLGKGDAKRQGSGIRADRVAGEIAQLLPGPGNLPSFMAQEDQARFFVGYYHQERALYTKTSAGETGKEENE
ncbi:MAG: type I-C CRISPR-associated protein Cas8c/Csd1 [Acidobacteria bacterium]|nr:type I-C CRISPR-associated protein Cas8c/Csd1 [Acidobacteriota bacterium]